MTVIRDQTEQRRAARAECLARNMTDREIREKLQNNPKTDEPWAVSMIHCDIRHCRRRCRDKALGNVEDLLAAQLVRERSAYDNGDYNLVQKATNDTVSLLDLKPPTAWRGAAAMAAFSRLIRASRCTKSIDRFPHRPVYPPDCTAAICTLLCGDIQDKPGGNRRKSGRPTRSARCRIWPRESLKPLTRYMPAKNANTSDIRPLCWFLRSREARLLRGF